MDPRRLECTHGWRRRPRSRQRGRQRGHRRARLRLFHFSRKTERELSHFSPYCIKDEIWSVVTQPDKDCTYINDDGTPYKDAESISPVLAPSTHAVGARGRSKFYRYRKCHSSSSSSSVAAAAATAAATATAAVPKKAPTPKFSCQSATPVEDIQDSLHCKRFSPSLTYIQP